MFRDPGAAWRELTSLRTRRGPCAGNADPGSRSRASVFVEPAKSRWRRATTFGRSLKHLLNALADLESYGVAFISLRDNLDLSTPSGRLMFQLIASMGEFEKALTQERVICGLKHVPCENVRMTFHCSFGTSSIALQPA